MAEPISDIAALEALYGTPGAPSLRKVARFMTPLYRHWIMASKFCVLSTVGPDGTDGSPRGDSGPVVLEQDPKTLLMPDWRGNDRLDSLRNIVNDGRVSLMFMIAGSNTIVRVNGRAYLTANAELRAQFDKAGRQPATVIVIEISEIYTQCARALMRSELWSDPDTNDDLPTAGQILAEMTDGEEGGAPYDEAWPARAVKSMW